jgi:hypothetical protein
MESDRRREPETQLTRQDPRRETLAQRDDRNFLELIQELRVVGLGVQVLFGFLLSLPFTVRFSGLSQGQRDLYVACGSPFRWPAARRLRAGGCDSGPPITGSLPQPRARPQVGWSWRRTLR